jgi:hypothetical protein
MFTAFFIKEYKSSGISGATPLFLRILKIFEPVIRLLWGIAKLSLKITPI